MSFHSRKRFLIVISDAFPTT